MAISLDEQDKKETSLESKITNKRNAVLWYSYDMADTFFSQAVISLAFTPFALLLGVDLGWTYKTAFIVVSIFMASSNLLIAIFGPILGAISDKAGKRKPAVLMAASIMVATTALITVWLNFWWACSLFIVANFCYQAGRMFYDAQIPFVAKTENRGIIQSIGGALAAFGSVIAIGLGLLINSEKTFGVHTEVNTAIWEIGETHITEVNYGGLRWLFLFAAAVIILLSIPYLFHKEIENPPEEALTPKEYLKSSLKSFKESLGNIVRDRNSWLFFLAWFFITDAANTTILYMVPVVDTVGAMGTMMTYIVILSGIVFSIIFGVIIGILMNKWGPKKLFLFVGVSWFIAIILFILTGMPFKSFTMPKEIIWVGAIFIGIGFGGIWIVGRQFIMVIAPPSKLAQYGGFQKIAGRVSAIVSPLLFGLMVFIADPLGPEWAIRIALASLLVLFSIGIILTMFIKDPHKRYMKGERAPYKGIYDDK
ncbi:MAG: MFS transporter [Candidatus Heimdallarchaeota archaeon]|nr:MFS transporter [Candidatus Heimdallarchaeota archaeon]MCG3257616.1 MFS transporter [Candidatus Heimdallarchaeota archaeon]MCK4612668.1 MFS transporter [Candidatus Heimdallarchaeota archaeon]